jgi:CheY-like chemotaxis protein
METEKYTKILVVEDNADDSLMLIRQLQKAQLDDHVTFVDNGQRALDLLLEAKEPLLAVFLDLRLPGVSGIEILEKMRRESHLQTVPVIVMTGSTDPKDLEECGRLGVTAFLSKPIDLTTFIKTVAHLFPPKTPPKP